MDSLIDLVTQAPALAIALLAIASTPFLAICYAIDRWNAGASRRAFRRRLRHVAARRIRT